MAEFLEDYAKEVDCFTTVKPLQGLTLKWIVVYVMVKYRNNNNVAGILVIWTVHANMRIPHTSQQ